ncbi:MAG TPA: D-alanyl-D-alanine carboxypeptidase/D-alanyl-D-alanine-endopeptidase [Pyrinomonadaceae bacterium]|nr:D-alanyl-D-alanine carboxypeptidase/D-alanyl-D-alanine-endopeptidase [Pyrinomonadaceae bacterium]
MINKFRAPTYLLFLLLLSLIQSALPIAAQQQQPQPQRERRVAPTANAKSTPTPSPSPTVAPTQTTTVEVPQPSPSPTPDVAKLRQAATTQTLPELQARISQVLQKPELAPAMVGIKVTSLDTGRVLFEQNANKLLRPASNMKLYTAAAALDRLSPDFRFVTSIYAAARPDAAGVIHGDLTVYGRGDPSIAARFNNGNYFKGIDDLAARIVAAGVKRIEGDLVGDETYFIGPQYGAGWEWEDLQWWYGAEITALTVNDNALDLAIKPGAQVGAQAIVTTGPPDPLLTIVNKVVTSAKGSRRDLTVYRGLGADELEITGSIAVDDRGYSGGLGISRPALLFAYLLRASLAQKGVTFTGKTRTTGPLITAKADTSAPALVEIAQLQSPPLSLIAAQTLKPSQNLYTELILRTLGKVSALPTTADNLNRTSEAAGVEVVKTFLRDAGISPSTLVLSDGSGLSRNDMITAEATSQLLTYMHRHRYAAAFRDALPIAGVDGTLRNRLKGTPAENNLRAKTGTLSSASSLSGYVRSAAGEQLAFSIMVNNYPEDADVRASCIDPIAVLLASFAGKTE